MSEFLSPVPPMGIYDTLYAFRRSSGLHMGAEGTHPWSQGYPLTSQLPDGPPLPKSVAISSDDLKYPKAWGNPELREAIAGYYRSFYAADIAPENVMVFAGGRPGLVAVMLLLEQDIKILVEETEYTPYFDMLRLARREYEIVPSSPENHFKPVLAEYQELQGAGRRLILKSNPCNPTGVTWSGSDLAELLQLASTEQTGALIDEAYELFVDPQAESALRHIPNIDDTNVFVAGAATKGLQAPGIRVGWIVASRRNIEILSNYSTFGMGGVSRPSQLYAQQLLEPERMRQAHRAIGAHYNAQRRRYGAALRDLGVELFTGSGGFYHWGRLPGELDADEFNRRLFQHNAAVLPGRLCDMRRRGESSPLRTFFRFSFGPLAPESFESDLRLLGAVLS